MDRLWPIMQRAINGRRGAFQALFGTAYLILGLSYVIIPPSPTRERSLSWLTEYVPLSTLGMIWVAASLFGLWGSRQPRPKDQWSFIALTLAPTIWGFLYVGSVIFGTNIFGWVTTVLYWLPAGAVMVVSGMTGDNDKDNRETRAVDS